MDAPEEVVCGLLGGRLFEGFDRRGLRVQDAHHVVDGAVLAGRVEALQHDEQRMTPVGAELGLQLFEPLEISLAVASAASCSFRMPAVKDGSTFLSFSFALGATRKCLA